MAPKWKTQFYSAFAPIAALHYSGIASILMFHRVLDAPPPVRIGMASQLDITTAFLTDVVLHLRAKGYSIISLPELIARLRRPSISSAKCTVLTFDDGYAEIHDLAFPVLKALAAPFTLFLATGYPDRTLLPWWYVLERFLQEQSAICIPGKPEAVALASRADRERAYLMMADLFDRCASPAEEVELARRVFGSDRVEQAFAEMPISWEQVTALADDELVTIGAHTKTHPRLNQLSNERALLEMVESKRIIESRLKKAVEHFAYPYGSAAEVGRREFMLAAEAGFASCVTTRLGNIFEEHRKHLMCLPRISFDRVDCVDLHLKGVVSAFRHYGRRVVTA